MQFDFLSVMLTFGLFILIFSPILFSKKQKDSTEYIGWVGLFRSRWFGIPLIFLLLFGNYTEFAFLNIVYIIISSIIVSFLISLIANRKGLLKKSTDVS
ncbi:hypothetical protein DS745_03195 [Anaerobacillus alkaliphilus]|uniref:Uncharacterized protein n=1 Tax=Anaerobacillus alkaliphilus TaxID=1548597 RepID=A0A4V1LGZ0_9BACI|nr:hypothetical protein DS745_03195 [Anaerobacillus alkaliphilus]